MNVTIVGCGYVGTAVARYWRQELGFTVTATTTTPERVAALEAVAQQVAVVKGNDLAGIQSAIQGRDTVLLSVGARNRKMYEETYLHTAQTLGAALKQVDTVRQVIYTGSYSVYGDRNGEWVDEETPVAPANENDQILSETEQVLLSAADEKLKVCILRLAGIYGPGRELMKIFGRVAGTTRPGDGNDATNWIHLDDIVAAIEFARQHQLQGIYNLVDDSKLTSRELIDGVLEKHGLAKIVWDVSAREARPYNAKVSNQKLKAAGYQFTHPETIV